MRLALSTNWNSHNHLDGRALVEDVLSTGVDVLELGYALTHRQAEDIARLRASGTFRISSVHAYCPVPMGAVNGHPELYSICHRSDRERRRAVDAVLETARFAADMEAGIVVLHAGRVPIRRAMRKLMRMAQAGLQGQPRYERQKNRVLAARDRRCDKEFQALRTSLTELLPAFESMGLVLALENLPSWDAVPTEAEMDRLCTEFPTSALGYWHDTGHAQIREHLGLIHHEGIARRMASRMAGLHIHDVTGVEDDHRMPPGGTIRFERFRDLVADNRPAVLEPAPGTPVENVREAVDFLRRIWA